MEPFLRQFGTCYFARAMMAGGRQIQDLPTLPGYVDEKGRNKVCFNHVLGVCSNPNCKFAHLRKDEQTDQFCKQTCDVMSPGLAYIMKNGPGSVEPPGRKRQRA